ncbi:hypothetical protein [Phytohabitans kaempferiae]|uniref:Tetracyclin repressor-like C-terminal domain-containing protein n=1 Tax=Phytohabitans kaempferiae TaxID=1620943 RepID=A0ABV6MDG4_9ACTN
MSSASTPNSGVSGWTIPLRDGIPGSRSANSPDRRLPRGRHDLPREFVARTQRELLQRSVAVAYGQPGRWSERMRRGLGTLLHILAAEPAFAALAVVEVFAAGPKALAGRRQLLASYVDFFAAAPRREGQPEVPRVAVEAVIAGVYGVIFDHVSTGRAAELPTRLPELSYVVLAPFIGPRAAAEASGLPKAG